MQASLANMQQLASDLGWIPTDICINAAGEGMSAEYPNVENVGSYVLEGGVYVDWCGYPMGYLTQGGAWMDFVSANFFDFLNSIGVSTDYIDGFDTGWGGALAFGCGGAPFNRMWLSKYLFPYENSVIVSPGAIVQCSGGSGDYAYGIVGVAPPGGSGWYFYASPNVDECDLANFISYCLVAVEPYTCGSGSGSGVQPNCPSGYTWQNGKCVSSGSSGSSGGNTAPPTCPAGTTWNASQSLCLPNSGTGGSSGSQPGTGGVSTVDWLLVGGGIAAVLGLLGLLLLMEG
jgi:hypothetical protein